MTNNSEIDIKGFRCPNCAAMLNEVGNWLYSGRARFKCPNCGSEFSDNDNRIKYFIVRPEEISVETHVDIPAEQLVYEHGSANDLYEYIVKRMAEHLAQQIVPMMDVTAVQNPDMMHCEQYISFYGRVRIVKPSLASLATFVSQIDEATRDWRWH